ncbi:hypothetical protein ASG67_04630 [Sphingomonas sp. Leaf339]|uniref:hypothetical protein n=1 Tax=Sphingomonas sp. Leaf339 TaxID=1736343 RepID=UPI0006F87E17|nr:hypothetical protein [Sphingomonas sp. Leaf339]KQU62377.1 hypothetical protein ASG67_04630 [Sphingomonas sp. Leaf339]
MNAISPITADTNTIWNEVQRAANQWRGNTIHRFAQTEQAISETLIALSNVEERGKAIRLPHLTGQRFQILSEALATDGPFAEEGTAVREMLSVAFRLHEDLRPFLCHGVGRIALDRHDRWLLVLDMIVFQNSKAESGRRVIDERETQPLLIDLNKSRQKLASALQKLRSKLQP